MSVGGPVAFRGADLEFQLVDPKDSTLVRLFSHPGGEWEPPPEQYRNLRVDPPSGRKADYAVLYTAESVVAAAVECRVLNVDRNDRWTYASDRAARYFVARYSLGEAALFVPIDGRNRQTLGLSGPSRRFSGYEPYQEVAHEIFRRYGRVVHGLSWESFHRNQPGRVFALWHHHKSTVALTLTSVAPYQALGADSEWQQFLGANPDVERLDP